MTTQTPDAVREAVDTRVEIGAKALGLHRIPGGKGPPNPPTRWPTGPQDTLSGRDGTVPLTWDFAEQCRAEVRAILAALDRRAGDAGEEREALTGPQLDSVLDALNFVLSGEVDKDTFPHGAPVMERAYSKLSALKGRTVHAAATPAGEFLTETVRLAVWNAAKKKGISDEAALATVEAVIAELPTTVGRTTVPPLT
ncbi:hypothetical protein [Sphingomonas parapaucimobilis]|uniref:Uncharacterized protein n=1 Tax=Sphingomonas parapaucimobilis NBRC 15100 TaxID=1219049 RepID=A0A0A1W5Q5_9SPHN|nr:hypothetical protein [Sphingomonas parapaucimobilis]GAM00745.1 hypothetical protein SP5_035_01470 [Sphingomonas parapaucimobilis NBRC 15100]